MWLALVAAAAAAASVVVAVLVIILIDIPLMLLIVRVHPAPALWEGEDGKCIGVFESSGVLKECVEVEKESFIDGLIKSDVDVKRFSVALSLFFAHEVEDVVCPEPLPEGVLLCFLLLFLERLQLAQL